MKAKSIEIGLSYLQHLKGGEEVVCEWYERNEDECEFVTRTSS